MLGLILRLEVELQLELDTSVSVCAPVGRAPLGGTRTKCVSTQKPVTLSAQQMKTAGGKTMAEGA